MDQATLFRSLNSLGVQAQDLENLRHIPFQQAVEGLQKLQEQTKAKYKKLAFELHPDHTGGDEAKTKLFSEVTEANKWLQELRMQPPQPRMFVQSRVVFYPAAHPFGGTVSTSTSSVSATYIAHQVINIRVG